MLALALDDVTEKVSRGRGLPEATVLPQTFINTLNLARVGDETSLQISSKKRRMAGA